MTEHLPDVDVVIATHDRPAMLREAVAAVGAQTYPGTIRCLVVHDGSTPDGTLDREGTRRPVVTLANTGAPGLAGARNCGVAAGGAPLVAFCDDDDLWRPDKTVRQVRRLAESGAGAVVTGITVHHGTQRVDRVPAHADLTPAHLARHRVMGAHPSTVLVRRDHLRRIGPFDEAIPGSYGEDYDWMLRAVAAGDVAVVADPLVDVRWGASQFSRQWQTIVDALDYLLLKHPVFHDDHRAVGRLYGQQAFAVAALGGPGTARAIGRCLRRSPLEPRGYLAAAVATRVVRADAVLDAVNRRGHGI